MRDQRQPVQPSARAEPPAQPYLLVVGERPSVAQRVHDWLDEHIFGITAICFTLIGIALTTLLVVAGSMSVVDSIAGQVVFYACTVTMLVSILLIFIAFACGVEATLSRAVLTVARFVATIIVATAAIDCIVGRL